MPTAYVAPLGKFIAFTNVAPGALAGGKVWTYETGTTNPTPTWTDHTMTVQNSNPVLLDSAGRASIFIADNSVMVYRFIVKDANDVVVYTQDGIMVPVVASSGPGDTIITNSVPPGSILPYGGQSAPVGKHIDPVSTVEIDDYVLCDGRAVSRQSYATLLQVIGFSYGTGDGGATYNVPDMRQRAPLGLAVSGVAATRGAAFGELDHRHTGPSHVHQIPAHRHSHDHIHGVSQGGYGGQPNIGAAQQFGVVQTGSGPGNPNASEQSITQATQGINTGGPSVADTTDKPAFNTEVEGTGVTGTANPPFLVVNFIIKT